MSRITPFGTGRSFVFIDMTPPLPLRSSAYMRINGTGDIDKRQYLIHAAELDGLLRHTEHDTAPFILGNCKRPGLLHRQQLFGAVSPHPGENDADSIGARVTSHGGEHDIDRGPMPVDRGVLVDVD